MISDRELLSTDWVPGYSNGFLIVLALSLANEDELIEICQWLEAEEGER